jgi:hypothetical protein
MSTRTRLLVSLGLAFAVDRAAVFASGHRLRDMSQAVGNLKDTPQQNVETRTTQSGRQVIVIEPANRRWSTPPRTTRR